VAHDEQLYPGNFLVAAIDPDGAAQRTYAIKMSFNLTSVEGMPGDLKRLVAEAFQWVECELEKDLLRSWTS
jgi:hypothetical protein